MHKKLLTGLSVLALLAGGAGTAYAQTTVTGAVTGSARSVLGGSLGGSASSSANGNSGSAQGRVTATAGVTGTGTPGSVTVGANTNASASVPSFSLTSNNGTVELNGQNVAANASSSTNAHVTASNQVRTATDLQAYVANTMHTDANLTGVQVGNGNLRLTYKQPAKFLGFIPTHITATVTVDGSGNVSVTYPWYAFLEATNQSAVMAAVQTQVQATMNNQTSVAAGMQGMGTTTVNDAASTTASTSAMLNGGAQYEARLINAIHTALQNQASGSASVSGSAATSASY